MNNLDWLARNVSEWPSESEARDMLEAEKIQCSESHIYQNRFWLTVNGITEEQWQARRDELINKPSWDYAPEWAEWLAQDSDGRWNWYRGNMKINPFPEVGMFRYDSNDLCQINHVRSTFGEPLNDWRTTLEKRPIKQESRNAADSCQYCQATNKADCTCIEYTGQPPTDTPSREDSMRYEINELRRMNVALMADLQDAKREIARLKRLRMGEV